MTFLLAVLDVGQLAGVDKCLDRGRVDADEPGGIFLPGARAIRTPRLASTETRGLRRQGPVARVNKNRGRAPPVYRMPPRLGLGRFLVHGFCSTALVPIPLSGGDGGYGKRRYAAFADEKVQSEKRKSENCKVKISRQ